MDPPNGPMSSQYLTPSPAALPQAVPCTPLSTTRLISTSHSPPRRAPEARLRAPVSGSRHRGPVYQGPSCLSPQSGFCVGAGGCAATSSGPRHWMQNQHGKQSQHVVVSSQGVWMPRAPGASSLGSHSPWPPAAARASPASQLSPPNSPRLSPPPHFPVQLSPQLSPQQSPHHSPRSFMRTPMAPFKAMSAEESARWSQQLFVPAGSQAAKASLEASPQKRASDSRRDVSPGGSATTLAAAPCAHGQPTPQQAAPAQLPPPLPRPRSWQRAPQWGYSAERAPVIAQSAQSAQSTPPTSPMQQQRILAPCASAPSGLRPTLGASVSSTPSTCSLMESARQPTPQGLQPQGEEILLSRRTTPLQEARVISARSVQGSISLGPKDSPNTWLFVPGSKLWRMLPAESSPSSPPSRSRRISTASLDKEDRSPSKDRRSSSLRRQSISPKLPPPETTHPFSEDCLRIQRTLGELEKKVYVSL